MTLGPGLASDSPEAAVNATFSLLQQYTKYSFAPLVKAFLTAHDSAGRPHAPVSYLTALDPWL
jgi:hypothetical protein